MAPSRAATAVSVAAAAPRARRRARAIALAFFASGAAGLVFEIVWLYRCGLVFGNSVWATSLVLSSFMGGLAVGNALAVRLGRRTTDALRAYAALELVVGATGVALTAAWTPLARLVAAATSPFLDTIWLVNLVRLAAAFVVLLVPATAMGATLPILVAAVSRADRRFGPVLGRLYGWNTLGAVAGAIAADAWLVGRFGVTGSAWIAGALNAGAATIAWSLSRRDEGGHPAAAAATLPAVPPAARRLLACAFLSGACLMALEVIWFRFLSMFVTTTTRAASVMLAVVLAAIGAGGLAASAWIARRPGAAAHLPAIALAAACTTVATYAAFQHVPVHTPVDAWRDVAWFTGALALPTSLLSGVIFTSTGQALSAWMPGGAAAAGWLTLANTVGAAIGPLAAAFVMLPVLGMERSLFAVAIAYVGVGLLAARGVSHGKASRWTFRAALVAAVVSLTLFPFGLMAREYFARAAQPYADDGSTMIATREGPSETIFLMRKSWMGEPIYDRLVTNGYSMSGTALPGKRYMRDFVYWPMLLHEAPLRRVLVVCYGVGVTAGAAADLRQAESIDVVDVSRDIVAMSEVIYALDAHPLHDPRVRLHVEDGRYFLQSTRQRFDLITGEPPPPLTPGVVSIYTREYFRLIYDRLADGGMATYWLPVGRHAGSNLLAIARAFCDAFEDCSLWNATPDDLMLVGTRHAAGPVSEAHVAGAWRDPVVGPRLRQIGFEVPGEIGATFVGDAEYVRALTAATAALTDDYPQRLRLAGAAASSAAGVFDRGGAEFDRTVLDPGRARAAFERSPLVARLWPEALRRDTLPFFDVQRIVNRVLREGANPLGQIDDLHRVLTRTRLERLPLWILGLGDHPIERRVDQLANDGSGQIEYVRGLRALAARRYDEAAANLAAADRRGLAGTRPLVAYALCLAGRIDEARSAAQGPRAAGADQVRFWTWMREQFGVG